jgi:DNA-binding transcriptional regulator YhcF (GntR family)
MCPIRKPVSIRVSWRDPEAVYAQIARQIRESIAVGDLPPGELLPPVRSLASDLGVNLNTVARAYRVLEGEGFLTIRDRSGAEVNAPASISPGDGEQALRASLRDVIIRMRQAGRSADDLQRIVTEEIESLASCDRSRGKGRGS